MILWLLALLVLAFPAIVGYRAGVVRAACSLIGLIVGALLALPLGPFLRPLVKLCGVQQPILQEFIAPAAVFLIIIILFKIISQTLHHKVELYYEYKTNETMQSKWRRLSSRLGLCVGVLNGAIYFLLLLIPIYVIGYLTTQVADAEEMPATIKIVNKAREQMQTAKIDRFVAAHDPAPQAFYDASDVLALVQHNPLLVNRLSRYPDFLAFAERPEFQALSTDAELNNLIQSQASIKQLLQHPKIKAIVDNTQLTGEIRRVLAEDLPDLKQFLNTGKSPKFDAERILGRWGWDRRATLAAEKKKKNNFLTPQEQQRLNQHLAAFYGAQLIALPDSKVILKHEVAANGQEPKIAEGTWKEATGVYQLMLATRGTPVTVEVNFVDDTRLSFNYDGLTFFFDKEQ